MTQVTTLSPVRVPFVDLQAQFVALRDEMVPVFEQVASRASFLLGPYVEELEANFAAFTQAPYCVGVANGTDALFLSLLALGIKPGDEVITVANTFTSTAEAIEHAGGRARFVDVDPFDHLMDPAAVEAAIGPRTVGILPVHLFGQPARMDEIQAIADRHRLFVVEDAAQAHGATLDDRPVGSFGRTATYSFYPAKNLGAYGDAGAITTADRALAERLRSIGDHGRRGKYEYDSLGWGSRLDALQAAILTVKLRHLPEWTARRRRLAARYDALLADVDGVEPVGVRPGAATVYHLYVVEVDAKHRDPLRQHLEEHGILTGVHYPIPLHLQPAYAHLGHKAGDFPIAEAKALRIISLPMYPELADEQQDLVVRTIRDYLAGHRAGA